MDQPALATFGGVRLATARKQDRDLTGANFGTIGPLVAVLDRRRRIVRFNPAGQPFGDGRFAGTVTKI